MVQVVFDSPWQDEVDASGVGVFVRGVPQPVTDEQSKELLTHPGFSVVAAPKPSPASAPDPKPAD